ncbi:Os06g0354601 [Oryza sativa Japonica Group]|uniref:Os06g0354601 protein n=1 Tax=Oryza sativa subsp. japonica TaxID=39947 RepID=C7J4A8_ORYSJ|nr:Os06g0354601 [Oryza sativa Japonica Group]|eukprot:NP_001174778.1 Os06g0354601 [Oryza sativa Japonica Group]
MVRPSGGRRWHRQQWPRPPLRGSGGRSDDRPEVPSHCQIRREEGLRSCAASPSSPPPPNAPVDLAAAAPSAPSRLPPLAVVALVVAAGGSDGGGRFPPPPPLFSLRWRWRRPWMDSMATAEGGSGDGQGWIRRQASEIL